jgi:hypothetical protein
MTKLGKLYFDRGEYGKLSRILKQLHSACTTEDGEDDLKKGTQLLEIYALEIQMYTAQKNNKKLKTLYDQSLHIKSAIPHPLILGRNFEFLNLYQMQFITRFMTFWSKTLHGIKSYPVVAKL